MNRQKDFSFYLRWVVLLPGVILALCAAAYLLDVMWGELTVSIFGDSPAFKDFIRISFVLPFAVVFSAHGIAPSHQSRVAWAFAVVWAIFMLLGLFANLSHFAELWSYILAQLISAGVGFGFASYLEDDAEQVEAHFDTVD